MTQNEQKFEFTNKVTFHGAATKGPLSGATISVFAMDNLGNKTGAVLASTTSDNGSWTINVSNPNKALLLVEADGGNYIDESDSEPDINKKRRISLQTGEILQSILVPGESTAAINFFTYTLVKNLRKEVLLSADLIQAFNRVRSRAFNTVGFDPFIEIPTDPIQPALTATETEKTYALLIGSAAYAINTAAIKTGKAQFTYAMLDAMVKDFSDCKLDGIINGVPASILLGYPADLYSDINIVKEALRFRNNHYERYVTTALPLWSDTEFCNTTPIMSRVLPSRLTNLSISTGTLSPNFSADMNNYNITVPFDIDSIFLSPTADTLGSVITVNNDVVISGAASATIDLAVGNNTVDIVVTAEDKTTLRTYRINIVRNSPPVFNSSSNISVQENTTAIGNVLALDSDGGTVTYSISGGNDASLFTIDIDTGALVFAAKKDFENPSDSNLNNNYLVDISASDGINNTTLTMTITVTDTNDLLPSSLDKTVVTNEDTSYIFTLADFSFSDLDAGSTLGQIKVSSLGLAGSLTLSGSNLLLNQVISASDISAGNFKFSPSNNANGTSYDSFSFYVHDGLLYSAIFNTVTVDVVAVNDLPVATDDTFYTLIDQAKQFTSVFLNDSDIEDGSVSTLDTFLGTSVNGGTITSPDEGSFYYSPPNSFLGTDSFTYSIKDSNSATSGLATVYIKVSADNDGDGISNLEETEIYFTNSDNSDSDNDGFSDLHEITAGTDANSNLSKPNGTIIDNTNNVISTAVTWSIMGSPYWVKNSVTISSGGALTIDSGVVVKFDAAQSLIINSSGTLTATSNFNYPQNIIFTSVEDDSVQGDTSSNSAVTATAGDWTGIISNAGSLVTINQADIRYTTIGLELNASNPTISNTAISSSLNFGIYFKASSTGNFNSLSINGANQAAIKVEEGVAPIAFSSVTLSNAATSFWLINRTDFSAINSLMPFSAGSGLGGKYIGVSGILATGTHNLNPDPLGANTAWYLSSDLEIAAGATLNVADGVIIKGSNIATDINVLGTLNLNGSTLGVKITAFSDDSIGGDTNNDSSATTPTDQDWAGINYRIGSMGSITKTELWYGLKPMDVENTLPTIDGLIIKFAGNIGFEMKTTGSGSINASPIIKNMTIDDTDNHGLVINNSGTGGISASFENLNISNPGSPGLNFDAINIINTGTGSVTPSFNINAGSSVINANNGGGTNAAVRISGTSVNPSFTSITMSYGTYNFYAENGAMGQFFSNTFDNASTAAIYLTDGSNPDFYSGLTISNTLTPIIVNNQTLNDSYAGLGSVNYIAVTSPHVTLSGAIPPNQTLYNQPLGTGSYYIVTSSASFSGTTNIDNNAKLDVQNGASMTFDAGSHVILYSGATISSLASSTTTINDNSFFKLETGANLSWNGDIVVNGTPSNKVVFTSLKDDYVLDSNFDGTATSPARSDWGTITCAASCNFTNSIIRYATTGLTATGEASPTISYSLFDFNQTGIQATGTGILDVSYSTFINNINPTNTAGIKLSTMAATSSIKHSYFRKNQGGKGGAIYIKTTNTPLLLNNLFIENTTTAGAGAIDFDVAGSGTLINNTITRNQSSASGSPGGINIPDNTSNGNIPTITLSENIIWDNLNNFSADVNMDIFIADAAPSNDISANYNATKDASLTAIGTGNFTLADPFFTNHYYLGTTTVSPAIDAGGLLYTASLINSDFGNLGTTTISGTTDLANIDMGYHYNAAILSAASTQSVIAVVSNAPTAGSIQTLKFYPSDASSTSLGSLWDVTATVTTGSGSLGVVTDRGDGSYEVNYTAGAASTTDTVTFSVDGISKSVTFNIP